MERVKNRNTEFGGCDSCVEVTGPVEKKCFMEETRHFEKVCELKPKRFLGKLSVYGTFGLETEENGECLDGIVSLNAKVGAIKGEELKDGCVKVKEDGVYDIFYALFNKSLSGEEAFLSLYVNGKKVKCSTLEIVEDGETSGKILLPLKCGDKVCMVVDGNVILGKGMVAILNLIQVSD